MQWYIMTWLGILLVTNNGKGGLTATAAKPKVRTALFYARISRNGAVLEFYSEELNGLKDTAWRTSTINSELYSNNSRSFGSKANVPPEQLAFTVEHDENY
jgi:hypothetical protein